MTLLNTRADVIMPVMKNGRKVLLCIIIAVVVLLPTYFAYYSWQIKQIDKMIQEDDTAGVSELLKWHRKLANVDLDNATKLKPLDLAAALGKSVMCSNLISFGADVNSRNRAGKSPLFYAFSGVPNPDVFAVLLQNKADVTFEDENGETPLHYAACSLNTNIVLMLLNHGANPLITNYLGATPLDLSRDVAKQSTNTINDTMVDILKEATSRYANNKIQ